MHLTADMYWGLFRQIRVIEAIVRPNINRMQIVTVIGWALSYLYTFIIIIYSLSQMTMECRLSSV